MYPQLQLWTQIQRSAFIQHAKSVNTVDDFRKTEIYKLLKKKLHLKKGKQSAKTVLCVQQHTKTNSASLCVHLYLTCMSGRHRCPSGLNERPYEPKSVLHYVQKGGDFPVIL